MKKLLFISLLFLSCTAEMQTDKATPIVITYEGEQKELCEAFNNARRVNGLDTLLPELILTQGAEGHSFYMDSIGRADHFNFMQRANDSHAERFGEIITVNFITPMSQVSAILGSAKHRMILLGNYTHVGIYKKGRYLTVDLASYSSGQNKKPTYQQEILSNDSGIHTIVTTVAGTTSPASLYISCNGYRNGFPSMIPYPIALAVLPDGSFYSIGSYVPVIQKFSPDGTASKLSGSDEFISPYYTGWGCVDGSSDNARYNNPKGLALDSEFNIIMADTYNHKIRKTTPSGYTTTISGTTIGFADGNSNTAQYKMPNAICPDGNGGWYVADEHRLRHIDANGNVTTVSGNIAGNSTGTLATARYRNIEGITTDGSNLYISDAGNNCVKKINLTAGQVTLVSIPNLILPSGIAIYQGNLFVADETAGVIYKNGNAWAEGLLCPKQIAFDTQGNCYVANRNGQNIKKITEL